MVFHLFFSSLFSSAHRKRRQTALSLYQTVVERARHTDFYTRFGVPDTLDGRFELVMLHLFLVIDRLAQAKDDETHRLNQMLFDLAFADMDQSLRQIGIGDMSIGKHVKRMGKGFYGRAEAYKRGLSKKTDKSLRDALQRNLYGTVKTVKPAHLDFFADYMRRQRAHLKQEKIDAQTVPDVVFAEF